MALCTRCGRQTESAAEFCSGCGTYLGSGGTSRPRTVAASTSGAGYLRPFASRAPGGTALHPGDERTAWGEPDSGPHQWPAQPPPPDLPPPAADYAGSPRFGTGSLGTANPLTYERPDATGPSGGGFSLVPRGPFEPARPVYPQHEYPEQADSAPAGYPVAGPPPAGYPAPDSPAAGYPVDDTPPAGYRGTDSPLADSPVAGFPEAGDQGPGWLPLHFGPDEDPLTAPVPPEYAAGSGQYAPGPAIPAQWRADPPDELPAAPPDPESGRYAPGAAGSLFPATDSADWEADEAPRKALRSSRWITIAAAAVVLIICAATAVILLSHGKPPAGSGRGHSPKRPAATAAASPTIRKPITVVPAAASGPDAPAVVTFLTRYFSAINHHNFAAYRRLFSPALRSGLTRAAFTTGYGGTEDSQVTLHAITSAASGQLTATVTFTSHQQPAASPNNSACTAWNIALYLGQERGGIILVSPPAGYQATFRNC